MTFRERLDQIDEEHKINAALAGIEKETTGEVAEPPLAAATEEGVTVHCSECGSNTFREEHSAIMCSNCGHGPFCNYCWKRHIQEFHPLLVEPYQDARRGIRRRARFLNHYLIRTVVKPAGFGLGLVALLFVAYYAYLGRGADQPAETPPAAPAQAPAPAAETLVAAPAGAPLAAAAETPGAEPAEAPGAGVGGAVPLELVRLTSPVARNSEAAVTIQTAVGARCTIQVRYRSGPSKARGLGPSTADGDGTITWSWRVGYRTSIGEWPIDVACDLGSNKAQLRASLTVTE
jgi:hypothetical protein